MPKDQKRVQLTRMNNASKRMEAHAKDPDGERSSKYLRARADHERATRALEALGGSAADGDNIRAAPQNAE